MKLIYLSSLVALSLLVASVSVSQDGADTNPRPLLCDEAQEWYDGTRDMYDEFGGLTSQLNTTRDIAGILEEMSSIREEFAIGYPDCVAWAVERYILAMDAVINSYDPSATSQDFAAVLEGGFEQVLYYGQSTGFLYAIGVDMRREDFEEVLDDNVEAANVPEDTASSVDSPYWDTEFVNNITIGEVGPDPASCNIVEPLPLPAELPANSTSIGVEIEFAFDAEFEESPSANIESLQLRFCTLSIAIDGDVERLNLAFYDLTGDSIEAGNYTLEVVTGEAVIASIPIEVK